MHMCGPQDFKSIDQNRNPKLPAYFLLSLKSKGVQQRVLTASGAKRFSLLSFVRSTGCMLQLLLLKAESKDYKGSSNGLYYKFRSGGVLADL